MGDPSKFKVRVVDHERTKWKKIFEVSSSTHEVREWIGSARREEVLDMAGDSNPGDIFASNMHTLFAKSDKGKSRPKALGIDAEDITGNSKVLIAELCRALKGMKRPPAVVLIGCYTQPLLADIIANGVGAAFGIAPADDDDPLVPFPVSINSLAAADAVTASLMKGETLNKAAKAGTDAMKDSLQTTTGAATCAIVVECGRKDPNKSLQANGLLYAKG